MTTEKYLHAIFPAQPFGPLPDPEEDRQWDQIHFLFGQATLWAQASEDGMASFVVKAKARWHRSGKSADQIERLTLGRLQDEYKRYCYLSEHHLEQLANVLQIRNSLAHGFYRRRMTQLATREGREAVIAELRRAVDELQMAREDIYWNISLLTGELPL